MPGRGYLFALALLALAFYASGPLNAATITYKIDDLPEIVKVFADSGTGDVEIGGACVGEACFVTIPLSNGSPANDLTVVTLIEPGMVDTPFFDNRPTDALEPADIARAVMYAVSQPPHVDVNEILVRPVAQDA